jgi:hypothetical protein
MKKLLTWAGWLTLVCAVLTLLVIAAGMTFSELGSHIMIAADDQTIAMDSLAQQSFGVQLIAWAAVTFALMVVAVVVPVSLLFSFAAVMMALAFSALLLAVPAALLAAPCALLVWLLWFRKRKLANV